MSEVLAELKKSGLSGGSLEGAEIVAAPARSLSLTLARDYKIFTIYPPSASGFSAGDFVLQLDGVTQTKAADAQGNCIIYIVDAKKGQTVYTDSGNNAWKGGIMGIY